jgi:hypothetical protein
LEEEEEEEEKEEYNSTNPPQRYLALTIQSTTILLDYLYNFLLSPTVGPQQDCLIHFVNVYQKKKRS